MYVAARNTDPDTSREAAHHIVSSGKQIHQQMLAVDAVRDHPEKTSLELSVLTGHCRFLLARRLPEAEDAHLVYRGPSRTCSVSGRRAVTWRLVEPGHQLELVA